MAAHGQAILLKDSGLFGSRDDIASFTYHFWAMSRPTKATREQQTRLRRCRFAANLPARPPTAKDLKDVENHKDDSVEPTGYDTLDGP